MKKTLLATAILAASIPAYAAPTPSAYDQQQDDLATKNSKQVHAALDSHSLKLTQLNQNNQKQATTITNMQHQLGNAQGTASAAQAAANANAANITTLQTQAGDFVTKKDFTDDQFRQDQDLAKKANQSDLITVGDKINDEIKRSTAADTKQDSEINKVGAALLTENQERKDADKGLQDQITQGKVDQKFTDAAQDKLIQANKDGVKQNKSDIALKANTSDVLAADKALSGRIDTNAQGVKDNASGVSANKTSIGQNTALIQRLGGNIQTNATKIQANTQALGDKLDTSVYTTDKAAQATLDAGQDKALTDGLALKVDDSAFKTDQKRQDDALTTKADASALDAEIKRAGAAEQKNAGDITKNAGDIAANTTALAGKVDQGAYDADKQTFQQSLDQKAALTDLDPLKTDIAQNKTDIGTTSAAIGLARTQINTNTTALGNKADKTDLDPLKTGIASNTKALGGKVDDTAFKADQKRQDDAAQTETQRVNGELASKATSADLTTETNRATQAEQVLTNTKADKSQVLNKTQGTTLATGEATLAKGVLQNHKDTQQNAADIADHTQKFTTLQTAVQQAQDTGTYAHARIDEANKHIADNRRALDNTNKRVAANSQQLANHEQRIQDLEAKNQTNFNKLQNQQNKDRKEFRAGISGAIAIASIPQATQAHPVGFGLGVGAFNGESAISAGVSAQVSENVSLKSGLSWDTQGNVGVGAGVLFAY